MPNTNPLLQHWDLPPWSTVRVEHLVPAIEKIIADNRQIIANVVDTQSAVPTWDDLVLAIDEGDARLGEAQSVIHVLDTVKTEGDAWSTASAVCDDRIARYKTEKMSNSALFHAYQTLAQSAAAKLFDPSRQSVLNKILRKFRLSGIELTDDKQQELARLNVETGVLEGFFLTQLKSAGAAWSKRIDDVKQLDGLSQDAQDRFALNASQAGHDGWLLLLDEATYLLIMANAEDRTLREEYFFAYTTRASDQGPHADQFDNAPVLQLLLAKRHRKAQLLGFKNYAELVLMNRMAESTDQVSQFLRRQIALETPAFDQESKAIEDMAITQGITKAEPWDLEFLVEKLRQRQLGTALKNMRAYFPLDGTLRRLCLFSERMFGIQIIEQKGFDRWHDSVRLFEISEHGQLIGHIYVDPYHRKEAPDFAYTSTLRNRRVNAEGKVTQPIAILHGNFYHGATDQHFLLAHRDLRVLFHEFGHCLQHVLTRSTHHTLSGISQLGRDTAEFAGQFFELWCRSGEFLMWLGAHYQTGERLTQARVDAALAAIQMYNSQPTTQLLMSALFDFEVHLGKEGRNAQQVFEEVQKEFTHLHLPSWCRLPNSFDYLVTGYEASVYAYKWSGVLATEAFKRFEKEWVFNARTGKAFRESVFAPGDSRSLMASLEVFLERPLAADLFPTNITRREPT